MNFRLSTGALNTIVNGNDYENPILKILGIKPGPTCKDKMPLYRIGLTDGDMKYSYCILGSQLNDLVDKGSLKTNSVIRLTKYSVNASKDKLLIILVNLEVLGYDDSEMMDTAPINSASDKVPLQSSHSNLPSSHELPSTPPRSSTAPRPVPSGGDTPGTPGSGSRIFPIQSLNPFQNRWSIRARVSQKGAVKTWSNARGEGKLFNFTVTDESGEIRITAFRDEVDKFFDLIEVNKVYLISRGQLKMANKQYNNTNNEYEMALGSDSIIQPVEEDAESAAIPKMQFKFVKIGQLDQTSTNEFVDIVGIVHDTGDIQNIIAKTTQREIKKRDLSIVDDSGCLIKLTLWGEEAVKFDGSSNPVIVVKSAKVSDFGGRSLSATMSSTILISPSHVPEAYRLKGWYEHEGRNKNFDHYRAEGVAAGGGSSQWKLIEELKSGGVGQGDKADYFTVKGTVINLKKDNCMYKACFNEKCNKKVIEMGNGMYRCEKCNQEQSNFTWRLLLQMNIADMTDNVWVTAFQDTAENILEKKSDDIGTLKDGNMMSEFDNIFQEANLKTWIFRLRAKMETYNDENRLRVVIVEAKPVDWKDYSKQLVEMIERIGPQLPSSSN